MAPEGMDWRQVNHEGFVDRFQFDVSCDRRYRVVLISIYRRVMHSQAAFERIELDQWHFASQPAAAAAALITMSQCVFDLFISLAFSKPSEFTLDLGKCWSGPTHKTTSESYHSKRSDNRQGIIRIEHEISRQLGSGQSRYRRRSVEWVDR